MPVELNVNRSGQETFIFNETRLQKILTAGSLNEAQRMGLWDKLKDWFADGVKAEAIRQLYESIAAPQQHDSHPMMMLDRFERLRALAPGGLAEQFSVSVSGGGRQAELQWAFTLNIGDECLYTSEAIDDRPPNLSVNFSNHAATYAAAGRLARQAKDAIEKLSGDALRDRIAELRQTFLDDLKRAYEGQAMPLPDSDLSSQASELLTRTLKLRGEGNTVLSMLRQVEIEDTHLLALTWPDAAQQTEALALFEEARERLEPELLEEFIAAAQKAVEGIRKTATPEIEAEGNIEFVSDHADAREFIRANLDNDAFSSRRFLKIEPGDQGAQFPTQIAIFEKDGETFKLEFSNRSTGSGELRGERLAKLIRGEGGDYGNLRELLGRTWGTCDDSNLRAAVGFATQSTLVTKLKLSSTFQLNDFFIDLRDNGPRELQDRCFKPLQQAKVDRTNMLEVLMHDNAPKAYLGQADEARKTFPGYA